ncbi:ABC transporter ATP-binding protein [Saccharothrix sp.]|uniref:ABC transporter ATP-binding protein n=1 Tax=Saccharothrix sp. TaxID=1873460 RepID=UPI0028126B04|nr:ABC transporter ATP-binding protein [Saccharothrix sp.]
MLEFTDVHVRYGHVEALRGVSLRVERGEIVALLGNNGAGKSTTLCAASALVPLSKGTISFDGEPLPDKPWDVVRGGLVHVPEGRRVFSTLTVLENLQLGGFACQDKASVSRRIDGVFDLLPLLAKRRGQQGGTLSGGEQQLVAIGRALVAGPRVLMLDEPSMGLAPLMVAAVMDVVRRINAEGTTVLLVEQNARAALGITHRGYVLENGVVTLSGPASVLAEDPRVVEAYLGS